ncbi:MAG: hypothetical protein ABI605_13170 [Rhizobacter sp.]
MKKTLGVALATAVVMAFSGCIVVPPRAAVVVAPSPVYVAPTYVSPGGGWVWEFHPQFGWGWRHPQHGWHRGWR